MVCVAPIAPPTILPTLLLVPINLGVWTIIFGDRKCSNIYDLEGFVTRSVPRSSLCPDLVTTVKVWCYSTPIICSGWGQINLLWVCCLDMSLNLCSDMSAVPPPVRFGKGLGDCSFLNRRFIYSIFVLLFYPQRKKIHRLGITSSRWRRSSILCNLLVIL